jgi:uncharacterized membrane protein YccC
MMPDIRYGFITAVSCWLAALAAFWLHLDNPWWAVMSAWVIANPKPGRVWQKGLVRITGTIIGCLLGVALAIATVGSPLLQLLALFLVVTIGTALRFRSDSEYAWILGTVSVLLLLSVSLLSPRALFHAAQNRAIEITCGVFSASICPIALRPLLAFRDSADSAAPTAQLPGVQDEIWRVSIVGGIAVVTYTLLSTVFWIPSLAQGLITIVIVLNRDLGSSRLRAEQRIYGCLLGGVIGVLCIAVVEDSFLIWSFLFVVGTTTFARLHLSTHRWSYVGTQGGVALIMTMVSGSGPPQTLGPPVERLVGITFGTAVLIAVGAISQFLFASPPRGPAGFISPRVSI